MQIDINQSRGARGALCKMLGIPTGRSETSVQGIRQQRLPLICKPLRLAHHSSAKMLNPPLPLLVGSVELPTQLALCHHVT